MRATCASSSVTPTVTSTTRRSTSAGAIARSACPLTCRRSRSSGRRRASRPCRPRVNVRPVPLGVELVAVAGDTGPFLDDRLAAADDPVHERRLADVRAADDGDDRQRCVHRAAQRRATRRRSERPRPDAGRSATVVAVEEAVFARARRRATGTDRPAAASASASRDVRRRQQARHRDVAAEEAVADRRRAARAPAVAVLEHRQQRCRARCAPYSPVTIATARPACTVERAGRHASSHPWRAVPVGRRAVDPGEEPRPGTDARRPVDAAPPRHATSASNVRAMPMPFSCCGNPS